MGEKWAAEVMVTIPCYPLLALRAMRCLRDRGLLKTCSNRQTCTEVATPLTTQEMRLHSMDGLNDGRGSFLSSVCCCHCGQSILTSAPSGRESCVHSGWIFHSTIPQNHQKLSMSFSGWRRCSKYRKVVRAISQVVRLGISRDG